MSSNLIPWGETQAARRNRPDVCLGLRNIFGLYLA